MKINNVSSEQAVNQVNKNTKVLSENIERLSSGKEVNKFSDNSAQAAQVVSLNNKDKALRQVDKNLNQGTSYLQVAESGMNEVSSILTRLKELSVQGASDTVNDNDRSLIDLEVNQLKEEINRISENTKYNNESLLNGAGRSISLLAGEDVNSSNYIALDLSKLNVSTSKLGVSGLSVASQSDSQSAVQEVDDALSALAEQRALVSSVSSRLQFSISNNSTQQVNNASAKSKIEDLDYAREMSEYTSNNIKTQAATSVLAQANVSKANVLKLL